MTFELSSVTVNALVRALKAEGIFEAVLGAVGPAAREALLSPLASKWCPSATSIELYMAVLALGPEKLEQLNYRMMKDSLSQLVLPVVKVALAIGGGSPTAILTRVDSMLKLTNRGLFAQWVAHGPQQGVLMLEYGSDVPAAMVESIWRGVLRFGSELVDKAIRVDDFVPRDARTFSFHLSW